MQTMRAASTRVETSFSNRKPYCPWSHLKKKTYASSVMPTSLVAPVARATTLSLLYICCVLHAKVHPQRSARVARFARSLARCAATKQFSNIFVHLFAPLGASKRRLGTSSTVWNRLGLILGRLGADLARLRVFASFFFPHVSHILSHLKAILARTPPPRTPLKWNFLNVPNTHFSNEFSIILQICANRIVKNNQHKLLLM